MPKLKVPTIDGQEKPRSPQHKSKKPLNQPHLGPGSFGARATHLKVKKSVDQHGLWKWRLENGVAAVRGFRDTFGDSGDEVLGLFSRVVGRSPLGA